MVIFYAQKSTYNSVVNARVKGGDWGKVEEGTGGINGDVWRCDFE